MENKYFILNKVEDFSSDSNYGIKKKITVFQTKPWWWLSYVIVYGYTSKNYDISNYKQLIFMKRKWIVISHHWIKCNSKYNTERMQWEDTKK